MTTIMTSGDNKDKLVSSLESVINDKEDTTGLEGKKVMWVEDDKFLSDIIAKKLALTRCISLHATEGEEALRIISKEVPDIVVLDIILPGIDGFEILRRIKSDPKSKNIPVIILSNLGQKSDIDKGKTLGAERFLVKATVTPNDIVENIKELVYRKKV
jgi:CheY-like chemotaxis protein